MEKIHALVGSEDLTNAQENSHDYDLADGMRESGVLGYNGAGDAGPISPEFDARAPD